MGLIVGYERIKSKAFYHFEFELNGVTFSNSDGLIDGRGCKS